MKYTIDEHIRTARRIVRAARQQIKSRTGMQATLVLAPQGQCAKTPERLLDTVARALGMSARCYSMRTRMRSITDLRFMGALFLKRSFPELTLQQIAGYFGGQNHTSVLNALERAQALLDTNERFMKKYETVLKTVKQWLQKEG